MMSDRVSVLVIFYNQEEYVDTALESVLSQKTDFGVKIIVGDDGSSDGTCDAVNRWIARFPDRIELHVMPRGEGKQIPGFRASKNRLELLKYVDTEYFIYLDGDDYFCNEMKLQKQVGILDRKENSDCIACGHNTCKLFKDGTRIPATDPSLAEGKIDSKEFWKICYVHTDALLFRSSFIPHIKYDLLENSFNDIMITFSALLYGNIYYFPETWAVYLQTNDGIWTSGNEVVNLIRNLIFCDLALRIKPEYRLQTMCRFAFLWKGLYGIRKSIDTASLKPYYDEARDKNCKNAMLWCRYPELNVFRKCGLALKTFAVSCSEPFLRHFF